jgi:uncharacterized membrane protein YcaP (DUF421 family)
MSAALYRFMDPARLWLGVTPPIFLVEVMIRVLVLYLMLITAMRAMGRRMSSQLSRNELLALVSLAGAAGPALQDPTRGLLPPLVCASVIVGIQRLNARLTVRSERLERRFQGDPSLLVADGALMLKQLRRNGISRQRLFAQLRASGLTHLGMVERVYLEQDGAFCVLPNQKPVPGLSLIPRWDEQFFSEQAFARGISACFQCGTVRADGGEAHACTHCGSKQWTTAVEPS